MSQNSKITLQAYWKTQIWGVGRTEKWNQEEIDQEIWVRSNWERKYGLAQHAWSIIAGPLAAGNGWKNGWSNQYRTAYASKAGLHSRSRRWNHQEGVANRYAAQFLIVFYYVKNHEWLKIPVGAHRIQQGLPCHVAIFQIWSPQKAAKSTTEHQGNRQYQKPIFKQKRRWWIYQNHGQQPKHWKYLMKGINIVVDFKIKRKI